MLNLLPSWMQGRILKREKMEVPAHERYLGEIRDFITRLTQEAGMSPAESNNIKLALDEACSNVVRHAYQGRGEGTIQLEVRVRQGQLDIDIRDRGRSFDWKKAKTPDLNRYVEIGKKGGLGIWFIRRLMDKADYRATAEGNLLSLSKRFQPMGAAATASAAAAASVGTALSFPTPLGERVQPRRLSVRIKFLFPVMASVAFLVLLIFFYMFSNQSRSLRDEIMSNIYETTRRLSRDAVNYLLKQDDLQLTTLVKTVVRTNRKLTYAFILDDKQMVWAHSVTSKMFKPFVPPPGYKMPSDQNAVVQEFKDEDGQIIHDIVFPVYLKNVRLGTAHVGLRESAIQEDIRTGRKDAVLIFIVVLAVSTSGAYFLMTFLIAPIHKLSDGMLAVSRGKLDHRISIESNDEFGQIARVFNDMTQRFEQAQKNLLEQERIQQEMQVAQEIQHTLLPREVPQIEGYEVSSFYRSAKEVGGDYYDFVWVDENVLGIAVADVSGKGIPGSLVMTMIRTALRLEARSNHSAVDVMSKVNTFVTRDMKKGMFVTMFYIILDSRNRIIKYSSAGHNPMVLYREETDQVYFLKPRGFPLGIDLPNPDLFARSLTQESVRLKKGDLLVAYTDGITEAMNPRREQYGEKRMVEFIRQNHLLSADEFGKKFSQEIAEFTEDYPQSDDITCVAIKEKMMADDVQLNLRRKLFYLVEKQGVSVKEACKHLNLSPSTYYRLKQLKDKYGVRGLRSSIARKDETMRQISLEERAKLLALVAQCPEYGPKRLVEKLAEAGAGKLELSLQQVYDELRRLRLTTRQAREMYAAKKKVD